jgi:hypothetical protein
MLLGPLQRLLAAVDQLAEEQKPALAKLREIESTLDTDIPDPDDIKKPLDNCENVVESRVRKIQGEIPARMDDFVDATFAGQVVTDLGRFHCFCVYFPLVIILLFNLIAALLQARRGAEIEASNDTMQRQLRGTSTTASIKGLPTQLDLMMPYITPALLQILMTLVQQIAFCALCQGPRLTQAANHIITAVECRVNDHINQSVQDVVDSIFVTGFREVKGKADAFFPAFKELLKNLLELQEQATRANGLLAEAERLF